MCGFNVGSKGLTDGATGSLDRLRLMVETWAIRRTGCLATNTQTDGQKD